MQHKKNEARCAGMNIEPLNQPAKPRKAGDDLQSIYIKTI